MNSAKTKANCQAEITRELADALRGMLTLDEDNHQRGSDDADVCTEVRGAYAALSKFDAQSSAQEAQLLGPAEQLPAYDRSVVARIATQMGWTPPARMASEAELDLGDAFMVTLTALAGKLPDAIADAARLAYVHTVKWAKPAEAVQRAPSAEAAHEMGTKGGPAVEAERLAFEAWMAGHCWRVCGTWDGTTYVHPAEAGGDVLPLAMNTRQLWAAWRDRAALSAMQSDPQVTGSEVCTYPYCRCPFDAPADPAWCAKGLPKGTQTECGHE